MDTDPLDEAISLTGVQKSYGSTKVLRGVDLKSAPDRYSACWGKTAPANPH